MNANDFKRRLKLLGLPTGKAAKALGVSRYSVLHWNAGRRPIPNYAEIATDHLGEKKFGKRVWTGWKRFFE